VKHATSLPSVRRTVLAVLLATVLALALMVVVSLSAQKPADATTFVTKSFSNSKLIRIPEGANLTNFPTSCPNGTTIGAAVPYPSNISSSFPTGSKVRDVNVLLRNYSHTFPDDVDVLLVHGQRNRTIMSDVGGSNDVNNQTFKLDDEASNGVLSDQGQLVGGRFQPTNAEGGDTFDFPAPDPASANSALSGFDGLNASGGWKLFVDDNGTGDCGKIAGGWTVQIKAAVP
jgi:hypothetical protein